ncbi:MFS family permease [Streptomyces sp. V2I9]|nr:MFS family permease [Streptomyces sp. V2I9]
MELAPPERAARAGLAATAANMGGLGCGPLLAGLLAEYAPWPLRLPFVVHLALIALAAVLTWFLPETVASARLRGLRLRPRGLAVPSAMRGVFVTSALAGFAGFSLLGLFTAVAPAFVAETLDVHNLGLTGLVVFTVFLASTAGQALMGRVGERRALPGGCFVLAGGLVLVGASLLCASLPLLVAGALCGGLGQGLAFRGAVTAISAAAPAEHRAATVSAFFVIAYLGISLPVVGVGALTLAIGLRDAGLTFSACVLALALGVGVYVARRPPAPRRRTRRAPDRGPENPCRPGRSWCETGPVDTVTRFRQTVISWAAGDADTPRPAAAGSARELAAELGLRTVVLVEGVSDRAAVEALAERRGRSLTAEGVVVVPLGGATSITRFLRLLGPDGLGVRPAGLCDAAEQRFFLQGLERTGFGTALTPDELEGLGFFTCYADLEDELIRALGTDGVQRVIDGQGDLRTLRIFQKQPAQRERPIEAQLRRFMGTIGGRKEQYARALTEALDPARAPKPLDGLLAHL